MPCLTEPCPTDRQPKKPEKDLVKSCEYEYEQAFCAVMRELAREGMELDFALAATESSGFDILQLWRKHQSKDEEHIRGRLNNEFSKDDLEVVYQLLSEDRKKTNGNK